MMGLSLTQGGRPPSRPKSWARLWLAALAALAATGCSAWSLDGPQSAMAQDGPVAHAQLQTFLVTLWVSIGIFAVVGGLFLYCLVKFRVRDDQDLSQLPLPDQGHGNALLEVGIIFVSILLVGVVAVPSVAVVFYMGEMPQGKDALVVKVTGLQWWWKFDYPALGITTANEVALPQGKVVKFELASPDVIHAFWIPRLGGKVDVMPGQDNWMWLQGDKEGMYYGQCAEFCGESHAFMRFRALVLSSSDFDAWVANQRATAANPAAPKELSDNMCYNCHTIRGVPGAQGLVGPDLTHFGSRLTVAAGIMDNTKDNIKSWLLNPNAHKPGNVMFKLGYTAAPQGMDIKMEQAEADKIADYLTSLK